MYNILQYEEKLFSFLELKRRKIIFLENMKHILCRESLYTLVLICEKGKVLRKHNLQGEIATSVILKPFIDPNERCHITDAPQRMSGSLFSKQNNIQSLISQSRNPSKDQDQIMLSNVSSVFCRLTCLLGCFETSSAHSFFYFNSCRNLYSYCFILMKGKALRKHSLHGKTAASVLMKLFISGNE